MSARVVEIFERHVGGMRFRFGRITSQFRPLNVVLILGLGASHDHHDYSFIDVVHVSKFRQRQFSRKKTTYRFMEIKNGRVEARAQRHGEAISSILKYLKLPNEEDAKRLNLLDLVQSFILPNSGRNIESKYIDMADDLDEFNNFPWGQKLYDFLHTQIQSFVWYRSAPNKNSDNALSVHGCTWVTDNTDRETVQGEDQFPSSINSDLPTSYGKQGKSLYDCKTETGELSGQTKDLDSNNNHEAGRQNGKHGVEESNKKVEMDVNVRSFPNQQWQGKEVTSLDDIPELKKEYDENVDVLVGNEGVATVDEGNGEILEVLAGKEVTSLGDSYVEKNDQVEIDTNMESVHEVGELKDAMKDIDESVGKQTKAVKIVSFIIENEADMLECGFSERTSRVLTDHEKEERGMRHAHKISDLDHPFDPELTTVLMKSITSRQLISNQRLAVKKAINLYLKCITRGYILNNRTIENEDRIYVLNVCGPQLIQKAYFDWNKEYAVKVAKN
ncbi:hypothetical protein GIB67_016822 [Kingdonia uniflora]|uniref:DUF1985 domain-containing protein n=1 Tax=Kingdonia uniflora TaxID=39325 RepID=A0A7J7LRS9_9MAGN|nr:hypothetical protein GIB67_016822 [Kingdonia uniflora]